MSFRFSQRSYTNLVGVRPELVVVAARALLISPVDFLVTEGLRSKDRQAHLVRSGAHRPDLHAGLLPVQVLLREIEGRWCDISDHLHHLARTLREELSDV